MIRNHLACVLLLAGCNAGAITQGDPGPAGPAGPPGPPGAGVAKEGTRLRPLAWVMSDGAASASGRWEDKGRGEICTLADLPDGSTRCLPEHRRQMTIPDTFADSTCEGPRALVVHEPGYILESSTGALYQLGAPIPDAWQISDADCVPAPSGGEQWYSWVEIDLEAFVSAELDH